MDNRYTKMASVPKDALKEINYGALKGKSDINPQWRYEALTDTFGLCGIGWKYEIVDTHTEPVTATGELMVFVQINLYFKDGETWSEPIPGFGGDFLIVKDKNGIHGNDEGYKMATTDALGTAAKLIGVAADIYRGKYDSKYSRYNTANTSNYAPNQTHSTNPQTVNDYYQLVVTYARKNKAIGYIVAILKDSFHKTKFSELSLTEAKSFYDHMEELIKKQHELNAKDDAALMSGVG